MEYSGSEIVIEKVAKGFQVLAEGLVNALISSQSCEDLLELIFRRVEKLAIKMKLVGA